MRFGLQQRTIESISNVFGKYPQIEKVIIYGSRAKGNYRNGSDIDITCIGQKLDIKILHILENELDDLLLPYSIDLSIFHQISNKDLIEHIERVGIVFYESN